MREVLEVIRRLSEIFDRRPQRVGQAGARGREDRYKSPTRKADRALVKAEKLVKEAEMALFASMLLSRERQAEFECAKQRPTLGKAIEALEYAAKLEAVAIRWELAERLVAREQERLAVASKARQVARAVQKSANAQMRHASAAAVRKSI